MDMVTISLSHINFKTTAILTIFKFLEAIDIFTILWNHLVSETMSIMKLKLLDHPWDSPHYHGPR